MKPMNLSIIAVPVERGIEDDAGRYRSIAPAR
jgi:hypothetical protein